MYGLYAGINIEWFVCGGSTEYVRTISDWSRVSIITLDGKKKDKTKQNKKHDGLFKAVKMYLHFYILYLLFENSCNWVKVYRLGFV